MYFTVVVKVKTENDQGKVKTHTERYLVDSMSVTEAEVKAVAQMEKDGLKDFEVSSASQSRIVGVID